MTPFCGKAIAPGSRFADHQSQGRANDGTGQAVDALECPRRRWAPPKEPGEPVPELVVGHEPVGVVLRAHAPIALPPRLSLIHI